MHGEIITQRRRALLEKRKANADKEQRHNDDGEEHSARGTAETCRNESDATDNSADDEDKSSKFGVLTAKARQDFARDCKHQGRNKIRVVKKQAKERWTSAAAASYAMPRTQHQGDECTFDFDTAEHPWAKIHDSHQAWFADLVAYCRICGAVNSKKGTMQKRCEGRPVKLEKKSEPNGLKVIRLMGQGLPHHPPRE